jgi:hypothetical protein
LAGLHTLLLAKFSDKPQEISLSYIENQVKLHLPVGDKQETSKDSIVESITSLTTAYFTHTHTQNGHIVADLRVLKAVRQSRRTRTMNRNSAFRNPFGTKCRRKHVINFCKNKGCYKPNNQPSKFGNRGHGGRFHHSQRPNANKTDSKHEADMAEWTASGG